MVKGKLAVCCLAAFGLLCATGIAHAGIVNLCNSTAAVVLAGQPGTPVTAYVCPAGDAESFKVQGFYIAVTVKDGLNVGISNVLPTDIWADDCDAVNVLILLCGGSSSSSADSLTSSNPSFLGKTTMSNTTIAAGNCAVGVVVVIQGGVLDNPATSCSTKLCLPVHVKSVDLAPNLIVGLPDLSLFAQGYPPNAFNDCTDYNNSNTNNLPDLSIFATHFGPPGHECP